MTSLKTEIAIDLIVIDFWLKQHWVGQSLGSIGKDLSELKLKVIRASCFDLFVVLRCALLFLFCGFSNDRYLTGGFQNKRQTALSSLLLPFKEAKHFELGNMIGIRGTPAIVLEDGTVVPGYIPAARLSEALNRAVR